MPNGAPLCGQCPLAEVCLARAAGTTAQLPQKAKPKPRKIVPVTLALVESPAGFLVQQRPEKGLLAGLWQPVLWEGEHLLQAEVMARLAALGLDTGTAAPAALPAAKHIFTHIEWLMSGVQLHVPVQSAPAGYVWASREQLRTRLGREPALSELSEATGLSPEEIAVAELAVAAPDIINI